MPMTDTRPIWHGGAPIDLAAMNDRSRPTWSTPHEIVLDGPLARLRDGSRHGQKRQKRGRYEHLHPERSHNAHALNSL